MGSRLVCRSRSTAVRSGLREPKLRLSIDLTYLSRCWRPDVGEESRQMIEIRGSGRQKYYRDPGCAPDKGYTCTLCIWLVGEMLLTRPTRALRGRSNRALESLPFRFAAVPECLRRLPIYRKGFRPATMERVERRSKSAIRIAKSTIEILGAPRTKLWTF